MAFALAQFALTRLRHRSGVSLVAGLAASVPDGRARPAEPRPPSNRAIGLVRRGLAPRDKFANREGRLEGAPHHKHGGGVARSRLSGAIAAAAPGARSAGRVRSGAADRAAGLLRQAELSGFVLLREKSSRGGFGFVKCSLSAPLSIHERVCINAHVYTHRYCIYINAQYIEAMGAGGLGAAVFCPGAREE